jgi:hypothetical protein
MKLMAMLDVGGRYYAGIFFNDKVRDQGFCHNQDFPTRPSRTGTWLLPSNGSEITKLVLKPGMKDNFDPWAAPLVKLVL